MTKPAKNTICLWYNGDAEEAANFYAKTFPDSSVEAVHHAPGDYPSGKQGDVLTVEFTVMGATGTRSSATAARKAPAVGAGTSGASRGRSRRSP